MLFVPLLKHKSQKPSLNKKVVSPLSLRNNLFINFLEEIMIKAGLFVLSLGLFVSCVAEGDKTTPKTNLGSIREYLQNPVSGDDYAHLCA